MSNKYNKLVERLDELAKIVVMTDEERKEWSKIAWKIDEIRREDETSST